MAFLLLLIASKELVLLYLVYGVVTMLLLLMPGAATSTGGLIIFNQNCLSIWTTFLFGRLLIIVSDLGRRLHLRSLCPFGLLLHTSFVFPLLCLIL